MYCKKKNTETLVVCGKEILLEVNADKTKYMVMSRDRNTGWSQNIKIGTSSSERVQDFIYLGTNLTDQNSIQEEIQGRLKSGNVC
jgi:hypothetical protein